MVNTNDWDADESNKRNDLRKYLDSLSRHQKQMIKGILSKHAGKYLSLEEEDFHTKLKDSLTLNELSKLSKEEKQFRDRVIRETMAVWCRHKEELKKGKKEDEQHREYYGEQADKVWAPKHHDPQPIDRKKIHSVSEAARLHKAKGISVIGAISGVQPLRKMVKGIQVQCLKCNTVYERKYDKPEFFESWVPMERIRKCPICKTSDYLGHTNREDINAVIVELKDHDTFSEIDPLRIIVFGDDEPGYDNTIGIERHVGETIIVTGDLYSIEIGKKRDSRVVAHLYVTHLIKYLAKQNVELTAEDVKAIKRFVRYVGQEEIVGKLAEMFATSVIGYKHVKKGLLLVAASTTLDKTMKKIHAMLVGDPGLAKSLMLKQSVRLVPNSTFESVQFATGKSLTAIVTNDEGDAHILRTGPIPQAKGAIAALNEMNRMMEGDQGLILDTMQEQEFTTAKFGLRFHVDAQTAIIGSANPVGGAWKEGKIDLDKIAMIKPLLDRFDLVFTFKDNRDQVYNMEYARQKAEMENRPWPDYTVYIIKHIMYAKQRYPKPRFSEEATAMLSQYYVDVRKRFGSPRIRETIFRIAQNLARLKLKDVVDAADAKETMEFYNFILLELEMVVVAVSRNPRDEAFEECVTILSESIFKMTFEELIKRACERNPQVDNYIGGTFKLEYNKRLRPILDMLRNHSRIREVRMNPIVLQYIHQDENQSDHSDHSDLDPETTEIESSEKNIEKNKNKVFVQGSETGSDRSDRSDSITSPYDHLIETEYLPNLDCTAYRCKEHPGVPWYYDLAGMEESHFKPFHTDKRNEI